MASGIKADQLSFRTATNRCVFGVLLQAALGLVLLLYSIYGADHAAGTAALLSFVGVVVWASLGIVFDQHRRERIEAAEAESFAAADAAGSSVFEQSAADLRVAARRLKMMHAFFLPGASLVVAGLLIGLGWWRFVAARAAFSAESFTPPAHQGWAIAIGLSVGVIGFIFARYISGMATQKVWANLRAGASFTVGSGLFGVALAVGHFVESAGPDVVLRYLPVVFPIIMIVNGAEVLVNLVLFFYRPRKLGEIPRPAFESWLMGFIAAPDRIAESVAEGINYQFGYEVTSSWMFRLIRRSAPWLALGAVGVIWGMSAFAIVQPHQRALILRFGGVSREVGPGLHLKWPWPVESLVIPAYTRIEEVPVRGEKARTRSVTTLTATGVRTLQLATLPPANTGPILWTNEHATEEVYLLVQPGTSEGSASRGSLGQGLAVVSAVVPMRYVVEDVHLYELLGPPGMRDNLLRSIGKRELIRCLGRYSVEDILGARQQEIADEVRARVEAAYAALNPDERGVGRGAGIRVLSLMFENVHPPKDVATSYEDVIEARQKQQAFLENARGLELESLTTVVGSVALAREIAGRIDDLERRRGRGASPEELAEQERAIEGLIESAGGKAGELIQQASATRWARHMGERARATRFEGELAGYRAAPVLYRVSMYLDTLRALLEGKRVYILGGPAENFHLRMELQDKETGLDVFNPEARRTAEEP